MARREATSVTMLYKVEVIKTLKKVDTIEELNEKKEALILIWQNTLEQQVVFGENKVKKCLYAAKKQLEYLEKNQKITSLKQEIRTVASQSAFKEKKVDVEVFEKFEDVINKLKIMSSISTKPTTMLTYEPMTLEVLQMLGKISSFQRQQETTIRHHNMGLEALKKEVLTLTFRFSEFKQVVYALKRIE
ncbi:MAG: hypothetical protein JSR80_02910 [Verrucomicrobia bacterium]|nr:hypothetical protein [Verrucomicrobiota bacterium]